MNTPSSPAENRRPVLALLSWIGPTGALVMAWLELRWHATGVGLRSAGQFPMAPSTALADEMVAAYGLLVFLGWAIDWPPNLDDHLIPDMGSQDGYPMGRMSPISGFLFLFAGLGWSHWHEVAVAGRMRQVGCWRPAFRVVRRL